MQYIFLQPCPSFNLHQGEWNYIFTIEAARWKGITFEVGYSSQQKIVAVGSYQVLKLKDYVDIPILDLIEFNLGYYIGFDRIGVTNGNSEFTHGPSLTLIKFKF